MLTSATLAASRRLRLPGGPPRAVGRRLTGDGAGNLPVAVRLPEPVRLRHPDRHSRSARGRGGPRVGDRSPRSSTSPTRPTAACSRSSPATRRSSAPRARCGRPIGGRWPLLVQGEASRDQLLRRFREAGNAILLGTDSFWEGVDVPGRALRALVLCKLPFKVPSRAAHVGAARAPGGAGRGRVHGLPAAARGAQAQAGVRPADPQPARRRAWWCCSTAGSPPSAMDRWCWAACRARSGSSRPGRRCGPSAKTSLPVTASGPRYDSGRATVEDRLHRPQLCRAREGAGQRGAEGAADLPQAAEFAPRRREARSSCRRSRRRSSSRARSAS